MRQLPNNPHDWALWLHQQLEGVQHVGDGLWQGTLPTTWNFQDIAGQIDAQHGLGGMHDESSRKIEFYPGQVQVYETVEELLSHRHFLRQVPQRFTVRGLSYTHGESIEIPESIANYIAATRLCQMLPQLADHTAVNDTSLHFIKSHDTKIEVKLEYQAVDLVPIPSLERFASDFVSSNHHADQKRNIVRSAVLEVFKGKRCITLSELLPRFEEFMDNVRSSYAMYTADFSYEKIKNEVEKQNLEDTLRLNKTLSEIQNQLLALPAALLIAGAGIAKNEIFKNVAIWIGICIFAWMMWLLVTNQRHSIDAIQKEIDLRKRKIDDQPEEVAAKFATSFNSLQQRAQDQKKVLRSIRGAVVVIWLVTSGMIIASIFPELFPTIGAAVAALAEGC